MANTDRPHGFAPYGPLVRIRPYSVDSSETTAIFKNDVVEAQNDGNVNPASAGDVAIMGVSTSYSAASTAGTIMVADDTDQLFEAQDDAAATPTQTYIFNHMDHIAGAGSTKTLISGHELSGGSLSASNGTFTILDLVNRADNAWGDNCDMVVARTHGEGVLMLQAGV